MSSNKKIFDKQSFIKDLEEDETNHIQEYDSDEEYNFSNENIKIVIDNLIDELNPKFVSIFDIGIFLGYAGDKLSETIKNKNLTIKDKFYITQKISKNVSEGLEERGLIDLELANEFRKTFNESNSNIEFVNNILSFMSSSKDQRKKIINNALESLTNKILNLLE